MEFLKMISKQYKSIYDDIELQTVSITSDDIVRVIERSNINLPDMLLEILKRC